MNVLLVHGGEHVITTMPSHLSLAGLKVPLLFLGGDITWESVYDGIFFSALLIDMFLLFAVFNRMASSDELVRSLSFMASSAMTAALTLRFIPSITSDAKSVLDAQRSRGLNLSRHGLIKRAKLMASLAIPVMVYSLERSLNIAESMESRGYTRLRANHFRKPWGSADAAHAGLIAANTILMIYLKMAGFYDAPYLGQASSGLLGLHPLAALSALAFTLVAIR
jgi:energy-coupling factor transport system permease protein